MENFFDWYINNPIRQKLDKEKQEMTKEKEKKIYNFLVVHTNKNTWNDVELYRWDSTRATNEMILDVASKYGLM